MQYDAKFSVFVDALVTKFNEEPPEEGETLWLHFDFKSCSGFAADKALC